MLRDHRRTPLVAGSREGDRVTNLELFFDLVYAFAFTQVTSLMDHGTMPGAAVDGFIVLSLLWFSWCSYAWLANQIRADRGIARGAVVVAMVAVFVASLALPDAFHPTPAGALSAAGVVVACYAVVRLTHIGVYLVAARGDAALRRQVLATLAVSIAPTLALLAIGAGRAHQRWIWLAAVLYDFAAIFVSAARGRGWRIQSAVHFAERHSLIVILALGESIVSIAKGLGDAHLTWRVIAGATLSILVALGLYEAYFDRLLGQLEAAMEEATGLSRVFLGRDLFTYLHFPIIVGIILTAFGVDEAMRHLGHDRLGADGGWALGTGTALFLAGSISCVVRAGYGLPRVRLAVAIVLLAASPLLAVVPPLAAVAVAAAFLLALSLS